MGAQLATASAGEGQAHLADSSTRFDEDSVKTNWSKILKSNRFCGHLDENDCIGSGRFGEVYRYEDPNGHLFALKRIRFPQDLDEYETPPTGIENIELLLSLDHKNVVRLIHVERGKWQIYLFLELMDGKNLKMLIDSYFKKKQILPEQMFQSYTIQMLLGLQYLHSRNIVHRDVKPANVMLNASKTIVKLSDFSLSKLISTSLGTSTRSGEGTLNYMAPEVIRRESYSAKSDIWSLGATIVEMLTGNPLFANITNEAKLVQEISQLGITKLKPVYDLSGLRECSADLHDLLDKVFQPYPAQRPSASALLAFEYFNFDNVEASNSDSNAESEYGFKKKCKGRVLIINNEDYQEQSFREGSKVDEARLRDTFEARGFVVHVESNKTASQMLDIIESFASDKKNKNYCSCIISILAHGSNRGILGIDNRTLYLKDAFEVFSAKKAPFLAAKPKVFIIQACRGSEANKIDHKSVSRRASNLSNCSRVASPADISNETQEFISVKDTLLGDSIKLRRSNSSGGSIESDDSADLDEDSAILDFTAANSDILVAYSTCSGYLSFRNKNNGSFFIQSLCDTIQRYWRKMSILDMLSIVSGLVGSSVFSSSGEKLGQIPQVKSTLRQRFFLSLPEERSNHKQQRSNDADQRPLSKQAVNSAFSTSNADSMRQTQSSSLFDADQAFRDARLSTSRSINGQKNILVITGGFDNTSTFAYSTTSDTWQQIASLSTQRYGTAAALWNGKMVVAGGCDAEYLNSVEQYDPETNSWTALPHMLNERYDFDLVCFDNTLFAIGGQCSSHFHGMNSVERFYSNAKQWKLVASLNITRRGLSCAVNTKGILAAGGRDELDTLSSCELFDGAAQTWKRVASLQTARSWASATTLNNKVYVFGGHNGDNKIDSVEEYDCAADKWTLLPVRLSVPRSQLASAAVNGQIYICGGDCNDCRIVEKFDVSKMRMSCVEALPSQMNGAAAVSVPVSEVVYWQFFDIE